MHIANAAESQIGPKSLVMYLSPVVELMNTLIDGPVFSNASGEKQKKKDTEKPQTS